MSVEGLQKLADELCGSSNPPFRTFGERIKEELVGVQDAPPVEEEKVFGDEDLAATYPREEESGDPEPPDLIRQDIDPEPLTPRGASQDSNWEPAPDATPAELDEA